MNVLNNSSTIVAPTGAGVVHFIDLSHLHKPDEPSSAMVGAAFAQALAATGSPGETGTTIATTPSPPPPPPPLAQSAAIAPLAPTPNNGPAIGFDRLNLRVVDDASAAASDAAGQAAAAVTAANLLSNATNANAATAVLTHLLSVSAQITAGGMGGTVGGSAGHKKCPYHRQCSRSHHHLHQHHHHHHQQHQQHQQQQQPSSVAANVQGHPYAAAWNRYRGGATSGGSGSSGNQRDAISTNVSPPPLNAVILADRYLMMEPVEGNNLYRCCDIKSHEELVCKIANNPCTNLLTAHFRLEGHPHVNPLQKVIQGNNKTYLLFSPSQGDLHSYVRVRKRLREPEARRLCRQMCEVVKSCHEQGIVLRDLKLRKFVFADRERTHLKLESLEDAVVLDDPAEDLLQDKRGCPAYVSPEILRANTTYSGKAADMWSLGVILYTMLVGRYPFNDSEHASLFAKISRGQFTVPECLSSKARCMIRALLRRDPEERIASEDVLFHPWLLHDDSKDHAYGGGSSLAGGSRSSASSDDHCVPEWFDPAEEVETSRMHYASNAREVAGFDSSNSTV